MTNIELKKFVNKLYVNMQLEELLPLEKYEIYIKPGFDTASWRFENNTHQIVIGNKIFQNLKEAESCIFQKQFLHSLFLHEIAHSLWTERNLSKIDELLSHHSYSFKLFNLFEDARIEYKMRKSFKKLFNWYNLEESDIFETPVMMFYLIIQTENQKINLFNLKQNISQEKQQLFKTVYSFYTKVIQCDTSHKLMSVIKEWYERFPETPKEINALESHKLLFLDESYTLGSKEEFDELLIGAENILVQSSKPNKSDIEHSSINSSKYSKNTSLLSVPVNVPYDIKKRDLLLKKMQTLFVDNKKYESTSIASKRLNIKNIAKNNPKKFKKKISEKTQKKNISIILDLSGSMYFCIPDMRLITDVLNKMSQKGIIDGNLILTGVNSNEEAIHQVIQMPFEEKLLNQISPIYGAEGLDQTMRANIQQLSKSDYVWIFTDGYIDEESLDKNFFQRNSIKTHAMYIGDTSYKNKLEESFDYVVCEKNIDNLAQKIFTLIK